MEPWMRCASRWLVPRAAMLVNASGNARRAIAMRAKSMPSERYGTPKVNRWTLVWGSIPTIAIESPKSVAMIALSCEPVVRLETITSARSISRKYSAEPKAMATLASAGARSINPRVENVPATNEPIAAVESAGPARPCLAISYAVFAVTKEATSQVARWRMEVDEQP